MSCEKELIMGEVAGVIHFTGTKIPVSDVVVSLETKESLSDTSGAYGVRNTLGKYNFTAVKEGFETFSQEIKIVQGTTELDIQMNSSEFTTIVHGSIRGNHSGTPQMGIRILLLNPDDTESEIQDISNVLGNFRLQNVPHGERMIVVVSDGVIIFQELVNLDSSHYLLDVYYPEPFTFIDYRDRHQYWALKIGTQTWMIENLAWLPEVTGPANGSYTEPRYYVSEYFGNNLAEAKSFSYYQNYGTLYNWMAARISCPPGWRLPSDDEWKILEGFLGLGTFDIISDGARRNGELGTKLKSVSGWINNGNGDNSSKFNVLPVGSRFDSGDFDIYGLRAAMWTSTESSDVFAWGRSFGSTVVWIDRDRHDVQNGLAVRCLKN